MTVASALASFAVVAGLLTVIPGLDTALVLRAAVTEGRVAGFVTALGVASGALVWGVAAAVGVSALLTASAVAFTVLRLAGAAYLVGLGVLMLWRSRRTAVEGRGATDHAAPESAGPESTGPGRTGTGRLVVAWRRGLLTNLLNPKVGVFYAATIPQFLPEGAPHALMGVLLALVHDVEGLIWFALIITAAGLARDRLADVRVRRVMDRCTGTVLVAFGARLAFEG